MTLKCSESIICYFHCFQTTIMAVEFDGGVVIGADSRTTTGYVKPNAYKVLFKKKTIKKKNNKNNINYNNKVIMIIKMIMIMIAIMNLE